MSAPIDATRRAFPVSQVLNAASNDGESGSSAAPVGTVPARLFELAEQRRLALEGLLAAVAEEHRVWQRQRDAEKAAKAAARSAREGTLEAPLALGPAEVAKAIAEASTTGGELVETGAQGGASGFDQAKAAAARRRAERAERLEAKRAARGAARQARACAAPQQGGAAPVRYVLPTEAVPHDAREEAALAKCTQGIAEAEGEFESMAARMEAMLRKNDL